MGRRKKQEDIFDEPYNILLTGQTYEPSSDDIRRFADLASKEECAICGEKLGHDLQLLGVQYLDIDPIMDDMGMVMKVRIQPAFSCYKCWLFAIDQPEKVASILDAKPKQTA